MPKRKQKSMTIIINGKTFKVKHYKDDIMQKVHHEMIMNRLKYQIKNNFNYQSLDWEEWEINKDLYLVQQDRDKAFHSFRDTRGNYWNENIKRPKYSF